MKAAPDRHEPGVTTSTPSHLRIGRHKLPVPRSRAARTAIGVGLIILGLVPLIPPGTGGVALGMTFLSIDHPRLRRPRRKLVVMSGRWLMGLRHKPSEHGDSAGAR